MERVQRRRLEKRALKSELPAGWGNREKFESRLKTERKLGAMFGGEPTRRVASRPSEAPGERAAARVILAYAQL
jgi:hypothetical protein